MSCELKNILWSGKNLIEEKQMRKKLISFQFCKDPNNINNAILSEDENWDRLTSADQIISISWDAHQDCYVVFWKVGEEK